MTTVINGSSPSITFSDTTTQSTAFTTTPIINTINSQAATPLTFGINGTEAGRFDTNRNLLIKKTSAGIADNGVELRATGQVVATTSGEDVFNAYNKSTSAGDTLMVAYSNVTSTQSLKFLIQCSGTVLNVTGTYGTLSDAKLKQKIVDATPKLDKINQLKVRNYNLIGDELKQIGFVAQEFEQVFPSMVDETVDKDENGNDLGTTTKAIKTTVLIPILVKAIQELNAKVEAQALEIKALKTK